MQLIVLAIFFAISRIALAMCAAGIVALLVGLWAEQTDIAHARGLDKIVALTNLCVAIPLAVFGALHFFAPQFVINIVPRYMPWRLFWVYFVGCGLMAASLSIASKIGVRWSGLLFGIMMFSFVAMIHFPGALREVHNRILWTIVFRESSFGAAGWILAATATNGWRGPAQTSLIIVGRILIGIAAIVFGIEHFLHPMGLPGVPLVKQMPMWVPGRTTIDYVTGAALLVVGGSALLNMKTRTVATFVGGWILLIILVIYAPVLLGALYQPGVGVEVEGINYFADTLLFAGAILALARAAPLTSAKRETQSPR
jgi:uncharacterized membrane protein